MTPYREAYFSEMSKYLKDLRLRLHALQKKGQNDDGLFQVMRIFHSIKSASAMMGYVEVARKAWGMELIYAKVIEIKIKIPEIFDSALEVTDKLEEMLKKLEREDMPKAVK